MLLEEAWYSETNNKINDMFDAVRIGGVNLKCKFCSTLFGLSIDLIRILTAAMERAYNGTQKLTTKLMICLMP